MITALHNQLIEGMVVRVPIDAEAAESLAFCRDFRVGRLLQANNLTCRVQFHSGQNDSFQQAELQVPRALVRRCCLRSNVTVAHMPTMARGILLAPCEQAFVPGQMMSYYAFLNGAVAKISETDILFEAQVQAPDAVDQLLNYEFHNPVWRNKRDQLLESFIELESATFGVEELVGSRVLLLPHQAETVARVLSDESCRYVLADEVGLGKTIEACVTLKGLRRRNPELKTVIVTPHTLARQWQHELSRKFWLEFDLPTSETRFEYDPHGPGIILCSEDLQHHPKVISSLLERNWDLLIIDEAHRMHRTPDLYKAMLRLSSEVEHCLVLSATPIVRHANEYLSLLKLMNPQQYEAMPDVQFEAMLDAQSELRTRLAYTGRALNEHDFDATEFIDEIAPLAAILSQDGLLPSLLDSVDPETRDCGLSAASETHSYLSENYRIENRVIRNRRATLLGQVALPVRMLNDSFSYVPSVSEKETLADVIEYAIAARTHGPEATDLIRTVQFAAASSYAALGRVLDLRVQAIAGTLSADNRPEIAAAIVRVPVLPDELSLLQRLRHSIERWSEEETRAIESCPIGRAPSAESQYRSLQVLRAIYQTSIRPKKKVLVFCAWHETNTLLGELLRKHFGSQRLAVFQSGMMTDSLQREVDRFQADPECLIMLSDESGGEGRNFQIASAVIHVDLPWRPAQVEQRIGRVDRLGRMGEVLNVVPYARQTLEEDLFRLWHDAFGLFTQSMSGMEIVLEGVQDEIASVLCQDPRNGLSGLLDVMTSRRSELREIVEEERYAEESAVQNQRRVHFGNTLSTYRDGDKLKQPLLKWADLAGLTNYTQEDHASGASFTIFDPGQFNPNSIKNAKFVNPPNMEEALRRSGRRANLVIRGTFDREVAVQREDLVFYAPGEVWTDAIIQNALFADRGQCAAMARTVSELTEDWEGFDCMYSIRLDPQPLFAAGYDPVNLFHAQGYLTSPTYHVLVGLNGQIMGRNCVQYKATRDSSRHPADIHLGKRSGQNSPLSLFLERLPPARWHEIVLSCLASAEAHTRSEYDFALDLADEAKENFERAIIGQRAAHLWLYGQVSSPEIDEFERITGLLVEGLSRPRIKLESVGYWWLRAHD